MSGVVIRCGHCGTTQSEMGECEACHEGDTQYFCPNHSPGRWLETSSCGACGAAVGVPGRTERPAPTERPSTRPVSPPPRASAPPPRRTPAPPEPRRPAPPREERHSPTYDERTEPAESPFAEVLEDLMRAGMARRAEMEPETAREVTPVGINLPSLFGCVGKLIKAALILGILAIAAFYYLFRVGGWLN